MGILTFATNNLPPVNPLLKSIEKEMEVFLLWLLLALLVGAVGKNRKIGFGWAFFWAIILSPLIGLIIALLSDSKTLKKKEMPKHRVHRELGEKAEFRGEYKEAYKQYMDSLYHLENDYKNKKLTKQLEAKRLQHIDELKKRISVVKENIHESVIV